LYQFLFSNQWLMADIGTNKLITLDADGILEFSHHILNWYENAALIIIIFLSSAYSHHDQNNQNDIIKTANQIWSGSFRIYIYLYAILHLLINTYMHNSYRNIFMAINQSSKYSNEYCWLYANGLSPYCKQFNQNLISTRVQMCLYLYCETAF